MTAPDQDSREIGLEATPTRDRMEVLVDAVQRLSLVRDLPAITAVVRRAARELTGADGATFILRDGEDCYYVDEDAIAPLWKGRRFPLSTCVSGWVMADKRPAIIEDIYVDPRVPIDAYRPTFVKSLAVVPIRVADPLGAIGNYWAEHHKATPMEVELLQALANSTAIALENVQLYTRLEQRVAERTAQLEQANQELEAFSYSVSHDLRAPLRHIDAFSELVLDRAAERLDEESKANLRSVRRAVDRMNRLIGDLLRFSHARRSELQSEAVDLTRLAREIGTELQRSAPERRAAFVIDDGMQAEADPGLVRIVLENLLDNAWKFSSKQADARIRFGATEQDGERVYFVQDNGVGFDMKHAAGMFDAFARLHPASEFPGSGVGLATVQRIIEKHGGRIWAEGEVGKGATISFTLPPPA